MGDSDRRSSPRLPYFAEVKIVGRAETYFHLASNISMGGVFLRADFPLPVGTRVVVEFREPTGIRPFALPGRVAWCREGARPGSPEAMAQPPIEGGMGVSFVSLDDLGQACLRELIVSLQIREPVGQ